MLWGEPRLLWGATRAFWQQVVANVKAKTAMSGAIFMQAPKMHKLLDVSNVSLDNSLLSLLKLAQMGLASREIVDEVRTRLLLSLSPLCLLLASCICCCLACTTH